MKILLVEDDLQLAANVAQAIKRAKFVIETAHTASKGLELADINPYDCIVLDINLPDGNGFDLLSSLRRQKDQTPIIIITARGEVDDRIKGLDLGADDYVPKPIDTNELIARIRAVIRRNSQSALPILTIGEITIKPVEHIIQVNQTPIDLTAREFAVIEYLGQHHGQVITRTMLMEHVWGSDFETFSNVVDVYIKNIRRKLKAHTKKNYIKTIRGKGYKLGYD